MIAVALVRPSDWAKDLKEGVYLFDSREAAIEWQLEVLVERELVSTAGDGYRFPGEPSVLTAEGVLEQFGDDLGMFEYFERVEVQASSVDMPLEVRKAVVRALRVARPPESRSIEEEKRFVDAVVDCLPDSFRVMPLEV